MSQKIGKLIRKKVKIDFISAMAQAYNMPFKLSLKLAWMLIKGKHRV